jgi:hypothetical protein
MKNHNTLNFARHFLLQKEIQNCQSMGLRTTKSAALTKNIIGCARKARRGLTIAIAKLDGVDIHVYVESGKI